KSVSGDNGSVAVATLPQLELASVDGSPVRLRDVLAGGVAVVLFVPEECPTCAMTLRRPAAPAGDLAAAGIPAFAIFGDPPEGAPAPQVTGEAPHRKPGCAAKSTYDSATLALINAAGPHDELEDMFERGWSDGLPVIPPTRERVDAMLGGRDPSISLGEVPP